MVRKLGKIKWYPTRLYPEAVEIEKVFLFPLYFFDCGIKEIKVNEDIKIVMLNRALRELIQNNIMLTTYKISHALILNLKGNKGVSPYDIEIIIRLFKKGRICSFEHFDFDEKNQNVRLTSFQNKLIPHVGKNEYYKLKSKEKSDFIRFINNNIKVFPLIKREFPNFYESLAQYNFSYDEVYEDKILRFCISFEAIVLKRSEREGITYKFANRLAQLIGGDFIKKKKIFLFSKELYKIRSEFIHGMRRKGKIIKIESDEYLFMDFIDLAEDYLRAAITKYFSLVNKFKDSEEIIDYLDDLALGRTNVV